MAWYAMARLRGMWAVMASAALAVSPAVAAAATVQADPSNYVAKLGTLHPGDTLQLAAGTYVGLALSNLDGTASQWITVSGPAVDPPTAVIQASPSGCCNVVDITNSSFLAIENLLIDGNHVPSAFGISAGGGTANVVHDIRIDGNTIVHCDNDGDPNDLGQQDDGISTKTPTWGWIIRRNKIVGAGTGLYLGNSDGSDPFIGGLIEDNLVDSPTGYCMEIKFQMPRPSVAGIPTSPTTTIIRDNVFIKKDHAATTSGGRPQVLVGGFPATGPGAQDRYEIFGNLFFHDSDDSLLQASGRVTIHDNLFVDAPGQRAIALRDQDLPLEQAYVYNNTIYGMPSGIVFGNSAPQGDAVVGNLVFAATPITGPISDMRDNMADTQASAGQYVAMPSTTLGAMDFYPLAGKCTGTALDESKFAQDTAYSVDFNGTSKGAFTYRGAYAGSGANPGWPPGDGIKQGGAPADAGAGSSSGGGSGSGSGGSGGSSGGVMPDAGGGDDSGAGSAATSGKSGGCGCTEAGARSATGIAWLAGLALVLTGMRRRRT